MATFPQPIALPSGGIPREIRPLHVLLLAALSAAAVTWCTILVIGCHGFEFEGYLVILALLGIGSALFIFPRANSGYFPIFDLPVYLTILSLVCFGLAPLRVFLDPSVKLLSPSVDPESMLLSIFYLGLGMLTFWLGCNCAQRKGHAAGAADAPILTSLGAGKRASPATWAVALTVISAAARAYLLKEGVFYYNGSRDHLSQEQLSFVQILDVIGQLGLYALIIISIERFCEPRRPGRTLLFALILTSECVWGLVSAMKIVLLQNFVLVALVASMIHRKFHKRWLAAAVLGLVVIYPFSNSYRELIRASGAPQVKSVSMAGDVTQAALRRTVGNTEGILGWLGQGLDRGLVRLDQLQCLAVVLSLSPTLAQKLEGKERWWMVPYYLNPA